MYFKIISEIERVEVIAIGGRIRDIMHLQRQYGHGRWRKMKSITRVCLSNGRICLAAVHWYEAHGIGKKKMKIKRFLE